MQISDMKLIWHIIRKDVIRDRRALVIWSLLFVGQVVIGFVAHQDDGADSQWVLRLQLSNVGLIWLQIIMGYILVARLVQADALIGTNMFWLTRPISAARLLAAKLAGALLIFGVLPVLLLLPWWLYCAFGWRDLLWTAVETFSWQLLVIAPAFLVASLTDDLGRVLLWTLLLVIGLLSWIVLLQASFVSVLGRAVGQIGTPLMFTRLWLSAMVLVTGGILIGAHQYLTRRFARSVGLVVLCLGLLALVGQAWPWNLTRFIGEWHRPAVPETIPGLDGVTFTAEPASGMIGTKRLTAEDRRKDSSLNLKIRARGLPENHTVAADTAVQTWTWPNGLTLKRTTSFSGENFSWSATVRKAYALPVPPSKDPETDQWLAEQRGQNNAERRPRGLPPFNPGQPPAPVGDGVLMRGYISLPNSFFAKMRTEPPLYQADLHCILFRPEIVTELPLKVNARGSGGSQSFWLQSLGVLKAGQAAEDDDVMVVMIATRPSVAKAGLWYSAFIGSEFRSWLFRGHLLSVNHVTGDVIPLWPANPGSREALIGGVVISWNPLVVSQRRVIRQDRWVAADPHWREHTTLVYVEDQEVARFTRQVRTEKFVAESIIDRINEGPAPVTPTAKP